ncbi:virB8 family protein [Kosakonia radicincitans]|uniref:virB8 family protein n=1 Tax=Kosakonia radicincitans TaxID=283686 RepID=UPI0008B6EFB2|nr:type IV secretion system protein [Kosakonia radicincitans]SET71033.1 type IV secretion system protein VirB8 [Kosakonia radicincitans]
MSEKAIIASSRNFEQSNIDHERRARKAGFVVGGAGLVIGILAVIAIIVMLPLKQTDVELYTVDNTTGRVEHITRTSKTSLTAIEAVQKAKVARYIRMREGYNYFALQHDYDTVQIYGTPDVNNQYLAWYAGKEAPDVVYQNAAYIATVDIISSQISDATDPDKLATVRFKKTIRKIADNSTRTEYWDIRMTFHFDMNKEMKDTEREENEFGFTVTSYQRDKEIRGGE